MATLCARLTETSLTKIKTIQGGYQMDTPVRKTQQRFAIELKLLHQISKIADEKENTLSAIINDTIREY